MVVRVRVRVRVRVKEMMLHFLWLDYCHGKKSGMRKIKAYFKPMFSIFLNPRIFLIPKVKSSQVKSSKVK